MFISVSVLCRTEVNMPPLPAWVRSRRGAAALRSRSSKRSSLLGSLSVSWRAIFMFVKRQRRRRLAAVNACDCCFASRPRPRPLFTSSATTNARKRWRSEPPAREKVEGGGGGCRVSQVLKILAKCVSQSKLARVPQVKQLEITQEARETHL